MSFLRRIIGEERRSGKNRRVLDDPDYIGPRRRQAMDRRKSATKKHGADKRSNKYHRLSNDQRTVIDKIMESLEKQDK